MDSVQFSMNDYTIHYHTIKIALLPKEFQLLQYLYQSPSIVFTREQLLNAVWPTDEPIDRTVDDHIYRIRKKILPLSDILSIETVRGQGYVLVLKQTRKSPLMNDKQISVNMHQLFSKYHQYGQGDALKLLQQNQELLGFQFEVPDLLYLYFMQGDFKWIIQAPYPFSYKAFYMLHIYALVETDKLKCLQFFTKMLQRNDIPEIHLLEIRLLNIILLLILTEQFDEAEAQIQLAKAEINKEKYEGFIPLNLLIECTLALAKNEQQRVAQLIQHIEETLVQFPFLREHAHFLFVQGIAKLRDNEDQAHKFFNEGFHLLQQSQFIPGLFMNCSLILFFIEQWQLSTPLKASIEKQLDDLIDHYQLRPIHKELEQLFLQHF